MDAVSIPKGQLGQILEDIEKLVMDVEALAGDQDETARQRLQDVKSGKVKGIPEAELDKYLGARGVKIG